MPQRRRTTPIPAQPDLEPTNRDYVMARLAAARLSLQSAQDAIDTAVSMFMEPDEDERGDERAEAIGSALEFIGGATRAMECAEIGLATVDLEEGEPWEEG